jgi:hypothetical protein
VHLTVTQCERSTSLPNEYFVRLSTRNSSQPDDTAIRGNTRIGSKADGKPSTRNKSTRRKSTLDGDDGRIARNTNGEHRNSLRNQSRNSVRDSRLAVGNRPAADNIPAEDNTVHNMVGDSIHPDDTQIDRTGRHRLLYRTQKLRRFL